MTNNENDSDRLSEDTVINHHGHSSKVLDTLKQMWKGDRLCPICGAKDWRVQYEFELKGQTTKEPDREWHVSLPLVPVMCFGCGYTFFMNPMKSPVLNLTTYEEVGDVE